MKTLIKILLVIGLLTFSSSGATGSTDANDLISVKVLAHFELDTSVYTVEILSDGFQSKTTNDFRIEVKPLYQAEPIGRYTIVATLFENDRQIESRQVRLFIHKFADVVVSKDRISRNDELSENSLSVERRDITDLREQPVVSVETIKGMRARRNLTRGSIVTTGDIESTPVIKSHSEVHIVFSGGLFKVTSKGEALQDGRVGEYIRVKNKSSNKIVIARVVDETAVAVE